MIQTPQEKMTLVVNLGTVSGTGVTGVRPHVVEQNISNNESVDF